MTSNHNKYCLSLSGYKRIKTIPVDVGAVGVGGENPIRIQSMTTTDTMAVEATVDQAIRMIEAGCEIVRVTAPSKREAESLKDIRATLSSQGYSQPLVADIHFTPNAAEIAAKYVEKVRINPGNYADKNSPNQEEYSAEDYDAKLKLIEQKLIPLIEECKKHSRAMRIGTNHGSLSNRIMSRFGDTPLGMVESALEFIDICERHQFYDIIISMKSSNPQIMVYAYRLLMSRMLGRENIYPLHLGVTEAGEGEDGRIKSSIGIGTLLEDGLGDTIRVSLTEEPESEIPVAKLIVDRYSKREIEVSPIEFSTPFNPYEYSKRITEAVLNIGATNAPVVVADLSAITNISPKDLAEFGYQYAAETGLWQIEEQAADYIYLGECMPSFDLPKGLKAIVTCEYWTEKEGFYPLYSLNQLNEVTKSGELPKFIEVEASDVAVLEGFSNVLNTVKGAVLIVKSDSTKGIFELRRFLIELMHLKITVPVILNYRYGRMKQEEFQLHAATDFGALLIDGMGDGIMISAKEGLSADFVNTTAFGILQATRTRVLKTEYISCPSCGRTQFNLQETTAKIRSRTSHLKGLKIAVMGCIVNGPGEMADADYGYVGAGKGTVTLYKQKEVVKRNVKEENALDELIALIKVNGDWQDA